MWYVSADWLQTMAALSRWRDTNAPSGGMISEQPITASTASNRVNEACEPFNGSSGTAGKENSALDAASMSLSADEANAWKNFMRDPLTGYYYDSTAIAPRYDHSMTYVKTGIDQIFINSKHQY